MFTVLGIASTLGLLHSSLKRCIDCSHPCHKKHHPLAIIHEGTVHVSSWYSNGHCINSKNRANALKMLKKHLTEKFRNILINKIPLGYIQEPKQISNLILYLCSDESNYITGSIIDINGGLLWL